MLNAEQAIRSIRHRGTITLRTLLLSDPARVRIEISDDGPGIPAEELPLVFDPFFSTKEPNEGTGLGLAVSRAIVREHGGEMGAESRPGGGATFSIELPVALAGPAETSEVRGAGSQAAPPTAAAILVVDDEQSVASLIADILRQQGYTVEATTDSRQALHMALTRDFDLIICDIKMPDLDGEALHQQLAESGRPLAHHILFTTGDTLSRATTRFLERVGLPCLAKPFLVDELRTAVQELLAAGTTRRAGER